MKINESFIVKKTKQILITATALLLGVVAPALTIVAPRTASALSPTTYYSVPFGFATESKSLVTGSDGNLWFAEQVPKTGSITTETIVRMTTAGTFTRFNLPFGWDFSNYGVSIGGMASGPDGAIWFTDTNTNQIIRLTTAGQFTNQYFPSTSYTYGDIGTIASGPDGNLWFTMPLSNKIGRISTSGSITLFPLLPGGAPYNITSGPDGNMWFTEVPMGRIAKISMAGVVTEYPIPNGAYANSITSGPDGNMWFTEMFASKVAKISTEGVITEYAVSTSSVVSDITSGPDGALWFLSSTYANGLYGKNLLRITTSGVTSEYPIFGLPKTQSYSIHGLTTGPDGALWTSSLDSNQIVRIDTTPLITPAAPTNLVAPSPTKVPSLSWSTVSGATSYKIYRDGLTIATTTAAAYTDTAATEATHTYYVTALNDAIESSASNSVEVTVDKTRPTMSFVEPTSFADPFATGPVVSVTAADASGLSVLAIHVYTSSNQLLTTCGSATPTELAAGTMSCDLASLPNGTYYIKAGTFDKAGNNKTILSGNFTIQQL